MIDFTSLNLLPPLITALNKKGHITPTPIQAQAIPYLLEGRDLLGIAQTGTGKTAAFVLPIIDRLLRNPVKAKPARVRALILTPTRELAAQINATIQDYAFESRLSHTTMFGGVGVRPQIQAMSKGVDILVATPGRLLDLIGEGHVRFEQLEVFVLDEADRMLDMGFIKDIKKVIKLLPEKRQSLFFSATMPRDIAILSASILTRPITVEIAPQSTTVERIDQKMYMVNKSNKALLLESILTKNSVNCAIIFTKTKHGADKLVKLLDRASISSQAIHGNKSQSTRTRVLDNFRSGKLKILVATDVAARGIDVPAIGHVINYDLPLDPESYVHRIGRTARAGKTGMAISFCDETEANLLYKIEKLIKFQVPVEVAHPYHRKTNGRY